MTEQRIIFLLIAVIVFVMFIRAINETILTVRKCKRNYLTNFGWDITKQYDKAHPHRDPEYRATLLGIIVNGKVKDFSRIPVDRAYSLTKHWKNRYGDPEGL